MNQIKNTTTITFLIVGLGILLLNSCDKPNITEEAKPFLTGDTTGKGLYHTIVDISLNPTMLLEPNIDTIIYDTLQIDFNSDKTFEFSFILIQRFAKDNESVPNKQEIYITSENLMLQLHPGFNEQSQVVKSLNKGEGIEVSNLWTTKSEYFLTSSYSATRLAPRDNQPYIPFKFSHKEQYGWLKFDVEYDGINEIKGLSVKEYCIKE